MSGGKTVPKSVLSLERDEQSSEEDRMSRVKCIGTRNLCANFYKTFSCIYRVENMEVI